MMLTEKYVCFRITPASMRSPMRRRKHLKKYASVRLIRAANQFRKNVVLDVPVRVYACMYVRYVYVHTC